MQRERLEAQWAQSVAALLLELPKSQRAYTAATFDRCTYSPLAYNSTPCNLTIQIHNSHSCQHSRTSRLPSYSPPPSGYDSFQSRFQMPQRVSLSNAAVACYLLPVQLTICMHKLDDSWHMHHKLTISSMSDWHAGS